MSVKSGIWVKAHLRRCFAKGLYGAVLRKGAEEAGAIYAIVNRLDGTVRALAPAPGPAYDALGDRRFSDMVPPVESASESPAVIERLARFDPDIWVIEIEDREGVGEFTIVSA